MQHEGKVVYIFCWKLWMRRSFVCLFGWLLGFFLFFFCGKPVFLCLWRLELVRCLTVLVVCGSCLVWSRVPPAVDVFVKIVEVTAISPSIVFLLVPLRLVEICVFCIYIYFFYRFLCICISNSVWISTDFDKRAIACAVANLGKTLVDGSFRPRYLVP